MLLEDVKCEVLKYNASNPFPSNYRPEIDVTEELDTELLSWYLHLVGILRWSIEIGIIDIFHETLLLPQYQYNPWAGRLEALYRVFSYLKSHMKMGSIGYDPIDPTVNFLLFNNNADWKEFYGSVEE